MPGITPKAHQANASVGVEVTAAKAAGHIVRRAVISTSLQLVLQAHAENATN